MKIKIHYLFIIFAIFMIIQGQFFEFFQYFICVLIHEYSHAIVSERLGYKLNSIVLMPYGAGLKLKDQIYSEKDEIKIAFAGPICNLLLLVFTLAIWWIFPATYSYLYSFAIANLILFLFNLLPAYPLDGGRILCGLISLQFKRKTATKIVIIFNYILSCVLFVLFIISLFFKTNFTLLFAAIFLIFGIVDGKDGGKYLSVNILSVFSKPPKSVSGVNSFAVTLDTKIIDIARRCKRNKFNLVYVLMPDGKVKTLTQTQLGNLFLKSSPNQYLGEILKVCA
ncbi:MAG: M50 family metallopeptidase [Christensenellales bacterium]